jgi:hypothetical protein
MVFHRVEMELRHIEDCLDEVEWMLSAEAQRLEERVRSEAEQMEEDQRQELYEFHQDTHWELSELVPRIIRNSMFVTAYAFLEWGLFETRRTDLREAWSVVSGTTDATELCLL